MEEIISTVDPVEWKRELKQVSSKLIANHNINADDWRSRLQQGTKYLRSLGKEFAKMEQQMTQVAETVSNELKEIEAKENHVNEMFRDQIEEYKDAKARLKSLEESKEMYTKRSEELTNTLSKLSADVASVKKKIDTKGSSITDTAPLVEIRSALQRLKAENKELDVRIGILDYQLTNARKDSVARASITAQISCIHGDDSSIDDQ